MSNIASKTERKMTWSGGFKGRRVGESRGVKDKRVRGRVAVLSAR
jgi:hypothetical protein